ncbi:MAG: 1-(5-phosphoribosyl)-5-[(5-phosphoribosylamino)methylideneamino] imidazole-4-carboxamide isomerase [Planctomycetes bacterium]|nr:1-(5-phosphoribosyl)-5-[(5-phosphoribosylamino)methylideneamino] imidazole-4-carboxamide isomerase [Planctomycetota bacterium]
MELYPAIDLMDGCAVRLVHGERSTRTVYEREPARLAARFAAAGAKLLHVVDLDGAFAGRPRHRDVLRAIAREGVPFEIGGGLRTLADLEEVFELGAARAVVGTIVFREAELVRSWIARYGARLVASCDAKHGEVRLEGWTAGSGWRVDEAAAHLRALGFRALEFTAIERDGTLARPDVAATASLARAFGGAVVASGGVGSLEDVAALAAVGDELIEAAIVGKALYEERLDLAEALALARGGGAPC